MQPARRPIVFETRHRCRFREMDVHGHMNMTHYVTYYADHRFEGMRTYVDLGYEQLDALEIAFHIRQFEVEYLKPLVADQEIVIRSFIGDMGRAQCTVEFEMLDALTMTTVSTARMRVACIIKATGRLGGWPAGLMERFYT